MLKRWVIAVALGVLIAAPIEVRAAAVQDALRQALTCEAPPLETVWSYAEAGGSRASEGFVGYQFGEEMDSVSGVALTAPLSIGGASTHNVVASLMSFHTDFSAHVHAQFRGDFQPVVSALNLKPGENGTFQRAMPLAAPDEVCPLTIELKPLDDGSFLLGCGWCNG